MRLHVNECARCSSEVQAIQVFCRQLGQKETWRAAEFSLGSSNDQVRELVDALAFEDEIASFLLEPMLAEPSGLRGVLLEDHRYHSAGVVRRLIAASEAAREESPLRALPIADAAVVVVDQLAPGRYDEELRLSLRGGAWRERANVLRFLGRYPEALAALDHAQESFRAARVAEVDLARLDFVRATVYYHMHRFDDAIPLARAAASVFREYGETARGLHVGMLEGGILFDLHQPKAAEECFRSLVAAAEELNDAPTLAFLYNALGAARQEMGDLVSAAGSFQQAAALYDHLGMEVEKLRTSWSLALIALGQGDGARAVPLLERVAESFENRGCFGDAALVGLDIAEQFALAGRNAEVRQLCSRLVERFTSSGMLDAALIALLYLRDAAAAERATPRTIQHVRQFLRRLSDEPALLFAPPPA